LWLWDIIDFLWSLAIFVFIIDLIIMLPLSLFKKTSFFAANFIYYSSYFFGFLLWLESAFYTFGLWGLIALIIGLIIVGVGVVPMAFLALAINGMWDHLIALLVNFIIIIIVRFLEHVPNAVEFPWRRITLFLNRFLPYPNVRHIFL